MKRLLLFASLLLPVAAAAQGPGTPVIAPVGLAGGLSLLGGETISLSACGATSNVITLTANQWWPHTITFTGALTAVCTVVLPLNNGQFYHLQNLTTGGFPVTAGGVTGAAVSIPNSVTAPSPIFIAIDSDGTNYGAAGGGSSGFPFTLGSTMIPGASAVTNLSGLTLTAVILQGSTNGQGPFFQFPTGQAGGGTNYDSQVFGFNASYWNGSAALIDQWRVSNQLGTGTNPTSTLNFTHTGSPGISLFQVPSLGIYGMSAGCAQFDMTGRLGSTGTACGAGSGGSGTVTSFGAPSASWPTWLVPTVTNSTTTPSLAVAASAIPNTALAAINFSFLSGIASVAQLPTGIPNANLANTATTVNGQTCALGSTCTITVGSSAFSSLTSGTNTTAAMVVGTGASIAASGTGTIAATTATALAATPSGCTGGQFATGISANGTPTCGTPAGAGTVNSGTQYSPAYYSATGTAVSGITPCSGLELLSASTSPGCATAAQIATAIGTLPVANGGTGSATAPSAGQLRIAQSATDEEPKTLGGDSTLNSSGTMVNTGINGASVPLSLTGAATTGSGQVVQQTSGNISSILGFTPVGPPNYTGNLATGVLADYSFAQGTGTTLLDVSGANACSGAPCNGTFGVSGGNSPAWSGTTGVYFGTTSSDGISLPAALNSWKTIIVAYYINPMSTAPGASTGTNQNGYLPIISSSVAQSAAGTTLLAHAPCSGGTGGGFYSFSLWSTGVCKSASANFGAGFHIITFVCGVSGTTVDHIYYDATEVTYGIQGASCGLQTTGNLYFGTSPTWLSQGATMTLYEARFYSGQLTAFDVAQNTSIFKQIILSRGVNVAPQAFNISNPILHCIGDSQTIGLGVGSAFCALLTLTTPVTYSVYNWGISSTTAQYAASQEANRVAQFCPTNVGPPSIAHVLYGTNDWTINGATPTVGAGKIFANLMAEVTALKRGGCTVFVSTMYNRYGTDPGGNQYGADQLAYNNLIRQNAKVSGYILSDLAANPNIGATGAATNTASTYWQAGGLHVSAAGTTLVAAEMSNAVNAYFGTTVANPTNLTTSTYSMLSGDTYLLDAYTAASTVTLPDCLGQTGAVYTISNPTTFTISLKNLLSAEPINGTDYSTTGLTLAGPITTLTDRALGGASAGCVWDLK